MSKHAEITPQLPIGLYEQVLDDELARTLKSLERSGGLQAVTAPLDPGDSHDVLARYLAGRIARALRAEAEKPGGDEAARMTRQVALCNRLLALSEPESEAALLPPEPAARLMAIRHAGGDAAAARPTTPLSASCLLTGARRDPTLLSQLKAEIATADRVDMLCSFIKWSGVRVLAGELRTLAETRARPLRLVTTSYTGATDQRAVDFLRDLPGAQVRVSYDTKRTRLHAKAYLFHRDSGFGTAYIGSSNLSDPAMTDGLEWNVKISQYESPHLWAKIVATFDAYWNDDSEFAPYTDAEEDRARLHAALLRERGGADLYSPGGDSQMAALFDLRPYPFQQEILDRLTADRELRDLWRNLVIAATGTGKTMVAAFDYKRFRAGRAARGETSRLLFVAHREEILKQSLHTFRAVLRDPNFGDLHVGRFKPGQDDHRFVSIQTYHSAELHEQFAADHFDYVVVDEFHHAEAPTYARLLDHVRPRVLLGLTATPERADGRDILRHFGGHVSAEIRLPEAVSRRLLCPFQYFGITDPVDHSRLAWRRGAYAPEALEREYVGSDVRTGAILQAVADKLLDPRRARALGFCVSVAHARYMAQCFRAAGLAAEHLSGESPADVRDNVQRRLRDREINFLFVVDLYNEGVDIPEVDTVLFLRPTESLTVFLQQLGRGLRLSEGKECLTVLDFVGQAHDRYDWGSRFRALLDAPKNRLDREVEAGFPHAPPGCSFELERVAQEHVLESIRRAISGARGNLSEFARTFFADTGETPTLARFLDYYELPPDDLYRHNSWTGLSVKARLLPADALATEPDAERLVKGLRRVAHWDSPKRLQQVVSLIAKLSAGTLGDPAALAPADRPLLTMLSLSLWGRKDAPKDLAAALARLAANPLHLAEMRDLLTWLLERVASVAPPLALSFATPLELHGAYTRDEILAALGFWTLAEQSDVREGVKYLGSIQTDVFFVTLNKTEDDYSPTTMYEDYAVSDTLFHWQSQSTTSADSKTGRRYIEHERAGGTVLLFVREDAQNANGYTNPYYFLGPARYVEHTGSRPMSILWRLDHALPARLAHTIRPA